MKMILGTFGGLVMLLSAVGCQCCGVTERYCDLVDDVSDCKPNLDRFYRAEFDLNRIGKPDWCQSRINRAICPCSCQSQCGCGHHHPCNASGGACNCPTPCLCGATAAETTPTAVPATPAPAPAPAEPAETTGGDLPFLLPTGE